MSRTKGLGDVVPKLEHLTSTTATYKPHLLVVCNTSAVSLSRDAGALLTMFEHNTGFGRGRGREQNVGIHSKNFSGSFAGTGVAKCTFYNFVVCNGTGFCLVHDSSQANWLCLPVIAVIQPHPPSTDCVHTLRVDPASQCRLKGGISVPFQPVFQQLEIASNLHSLFSHKWLRF